jgi:maleate isomerase
MMTDVLERPAADRGFLMPAAARIGLIIPSSNRLTEPQFRYFAPGNLGVHVARLQMTGKYQKPFAQLLGDIEGAAAMLADTKPDLIVFHCTGTAMRQGPGGDAKIEEVIRRSTGIEALSTAGAVCEALRAVRIRRLVLCTPYLQSVNDEEIHYLTGMGFDVIHDVGLQIATSDETLRVPPERWLALVRENLRAEADGYFLSCTNTSQIEVIETLERETGKPFVSSNQAVLWACVRKLRAKLGPMRPMPCLGRLFQTL